MTTKFTKHYPKLLPTLPNVSVTNPEHFANVCGEVLRLGHAAAFYQALEKLNEYFPNGCELGYDFAPLSFSIRINTIGGGEMGGGWIFHPGETGPDSSMSVELCPKKEAHWSVHT